MSRAWMPMYWGDYLADTHHFTAAQHGSYLLLIGFYWCNGGLPRDENEIRQIAKCDIARWPKLKKVLLRKFTEEVENGAPVWKHMRIDREIAKSLEKSRINSANAKRKSSEVAHDPLTQSQSQSHKKDTDPNGSADTTAGDADIPEFMKRDPRADLFGRGLKKFIELTGRTPDSARAFLGKQLKAVSDDAILVLGAIDDAERNRVADPAGWISAQLGTYRRNGNGKLTVQDAARKLVDRLEEMQPGYSRATGAGVVRMLPPGRRE